MLKTVSRNSYFFVLKVKSVEFKKKQRHKLVPYYTEYRRARSDPTGMLGCIICHHGYPTRIWLQIRNARKGWSRVGFFRYVVVLLGFRVQLRESNCACAPLAYLYYTHIRIAFIGQDAIIGLPINVQFLKLIERHFHYKKHTYITATLC